MPEKRHPTISIIIKALNEERRIGSAIESALAGLRGIDGEVILADGGSSDRTIEIARGYPIKIVQLNSVQDRSCGAGAQLGFQYSRGRYLCLIDGDMQLHDGFLPAALEFLEENSTVAGVGGFVIDREISNLEFEQRTKRHDPDRRAGPVGRLNGCGVYRRSAVESIGHLTDRNLHGGEELDLAARLHARGWTLARIDRPAVDHYGHTGSAYRLLLRRVATRNSFATGELVRAAVGRPHFWFAVSKDNNCLLCLLVAAWWATIAVSASVLSGPSAALAIGILLLLPIAAMSFRWRSVRLGVYSVAAWNVYALSFLPGFVRSRVSPTGWIDSTVLAEGSPGRQPLPAKRVEDARERAEAGERESHQACDTVVSGYR
jgi:glycosyltransferase involved in cell wall biosynthesis